jgi:hypothetical protein
MCKRLPTLALAKLPGPGQESKLKWTILNTQEEDIFYNLADVKLLKFDPEISDKKFRKILVLFNYIFYYLFYAGPLK